jgi:hypothetical protein
MFRQSLKFGKNRARVKDTSTYVPARISNVTRYVFEECSLMGFASFRYCVNRRFGGTYRLHLQCVRNTRARNQLGRRLTQYLHGATSEKTA